MATKRIAAPKTVEPEETLENHYSAAAETGTAIAPHVKGGAVLVGGVEYEVAVIVTRSVLRQELKVPFFVEFESAIYEAPPLEQATKMAPPMIADVINLQTGECQILICNTVLEREIERNYPNGSYVGKRFAMCGYMAGRESNDYRVYNIVELVPKA